MSLPFPPSSQSMVGLPEAPRCVSHNALNGDEARGPGVSMRPAVRETGNVESKPSLLAKSLLQKLFHKYVLLT